MNAIRRSHTSECRSKKQGSNLATHESALSHHERKKLKDEDGPDEKQTNQLLAQLNNSSMR